MEVLKATFYTNWNALFSWLKGLDSRIVLTALFCFAASHLGRWLTFEDINATALLPISGVGLALIVLMGKRIWPGITIGVLTAHTLFFFQNETIVAAELIANVVIAAGITIEIVVGYRLYNKLFKLGYAFDVSDDTFKFTGLAASVSLISSTIGTAALFSLTLVHDNLFLTWVLWWMGNTVGILLFTPTLLSFSQPFKLGFSKLKLLEFILIGITVLVISLMALNGNLAMIIEKSFPYLIVPLFLWLSFRFNMQVSIFAILLVSLLSILFSIEGRGPFVMENDYYSILLLQIFIGVFSISSFSLSATVKERKRALKSVEAFNEKLEAQVKERTKKLKLEISERKKTESNLKVSNSELRKTNDELDKFVYSVSHDLRAPVSSVLGLIDLAERENQSKEVESYLKMMTRSVKQQDKFIHDILDISKNARLEVKNEEIDFKEIVNEVFDQIKFLNHKKVTRKIEIQTTEAFFSDVSRIRVIFNNLISNSIRYHNGKQPKVDVSVKANRDSASILVKDNGIGIAQEHIEKVFKMFYRATDTNPGSGLGLYIVKESIEKLNGSIKIDSEEGNGTEVLIEIPNRIDDD